MHFSDIFNPELFLQGLGPWAVVGLVAIIFAETGLLIGFFFPGDSLLFTAGMFCATGAMNIHILILIALIFLAAFVGNQVGYYIGQKAGPAIFNKKDSKLFKKEYVDKTYAFFDKYGARSIVLARFVPIVRTFIPVAAGVSKMNYRSFTIFNAVGAFLWSTIVITMGYLLGGIPWVGANIDKIFLGIVFVSILPIISELYKANKEKNTTDKPLE
ncbi:MAG: VTT domain-containing protein [Micrococcaceae bacterium]